MTPHHPSDGRDESISTSVALVIISLKSTAPLFARAGPSSGLFRSRVVLWPFA